MRFRSFSMALAVAALAALTTPMAQLACTSEADAPIAGLDDVIYAADTNDEALSELVHAKAVDGKGQGAVIDLPGAASVVDNTAPLQFAWHAGPTARLQVNPRTLGNPLAMAQAFAHGVTVSGKAYFLVVASADNPKLLRAFTKLTTFTPDAAAWAKLKAAKGTLTATVTTAVYDSGKIVSDGGPFLGKPVAFSVKQ